MTFPRLVIFDLDGTLVDSAPDLASALNHVLVGLGRAPLDEATVRGLIGNGVRRLVEGGMALSGGGDGTVLEHSLAQFMDYYRAHIADGTRKFDGVEAALDAVAVAGATLAICTNKSQALADSLIAALGWSKRFAAVVGGDSVAAQKPDGGHVVATAEAAGFALADTVYVGDSGIDVAAAHAAGIPIVLVGFGFAHSPVDELGGDAVIDSYAELVPALAAVR